MNKVKLSIIIPVYNAEEFLVRALDSAFNSSLDSIEVIVVDDASNGNCLDLVNSYSKPIKYIRHEHNKGLFAARYTGIKHASGEYIVHLDADDWAVNDVYTNAYRKAKDLNADVVYFNLYQCNEDGKHWNPPTNVIYPFELKTGEQILDEMFVTQNFWALHVCWNKLVKREVASSLLAYFSGDENINMYEDILWSTALFIKLQEKGRVTMVDEVGIMYFRHSQSLTLNLDSRDIANKIQNTFMVFSNIKRLLKENSLHNKYSFFFRRKQYSALSFLLKTVPLSFILDHPIQYLITKYLHFFLSDRWFNHRSFVYSSQTICNKVRAQGIDEVFLYGSDVMARMVVKNLKDIDVSPLGYIVSGEKKTTHVDNLPLYSFSEAQQKGEVKNIIVGSIGSYFTIKNIILEENPNTNVIGVFD